MVVACLSGLPRPWGRVDADVDVDARSSRGVGGVMKIEEADMRAAGLTGIYAVSDSGSGSACSLARPSGGKCLFSTKHF